MHRWGAGSVSGGESKRRSLTFSFSTALQVLRGATLVSRILLFFYCRSTNHSRTKFNVESRTEDQWKESPLKASTVVTPVLPKIF